jgi:amidase
LRIALALKIPFTIAPARLDPRVRAGVERLAALLADAGHEVELADPAFGPIGISFLPRSTNGVHQWAARLPTGARLDGRTRHNARVGRALGPALRLARAAEAPLRRYAARIFRRYDMVLMPTTAQPALRIGAIDGLGDWATDKVIVGACPYTWTWNVLGWPGVNVPAGFTAEGLPIGAQLLGPANSEPLLLALAAQLEALEGWHRKRPPSPRAGPERSAATGDTAAAGT